MRGLSKKAKTTLNSICSGLDLRPVWVINSVIESLSLEHLAELAKQVKQPQPTRKPRAAQYIRRQSAGTRVPRSTKYGFENMLLNKRYRIECGPETSLDMPQQAARLYASKRDIGYGYERIPADRVLVVWFYDPEFPDGDGSELDPFERIAGSLASSRA